MDELKSFNLYFPISGCIVYPGWDDDYDDYDDIPRIYGKELLKYKEQISKQINMYTMPEERKRGIMYWYHGDSSISEKVTSAFFDIDEKDGALVGVVRCEVVSPLSQNEIDDLKSYVSGQASDGWGEGFEQHEIQTTEGDLYVSFWTRSDDWKIMTETEFKSTRM